MKNETQELIKDVEWRMQAAKDAEAKGDLSLALEHLVGGNKDLAVARQRIHEALTPPPASAESLTGEMTPEETRALADYMEKRGHTAFAKTARAVADEKEGKTMSSPAVREILSLDIAGMTEALNALMNIGKIAKAARQVKEGKHLPFDALSGSGAAAWASPGDIKIPPSLSYDELFIRHVQGVVDLLSKRFGHTTKFSVKVNGVETEISMVDVVGLFAGLTPAGQESSWKVPAGKMPTSVSRDSESPAEAAATTQADKEMVAALRDEIAGLRIKVVDHQAAADTAIAQVAELRNEVAKMSDAFKAVDDIVSAEVRGSDIVFTKRSGLTAHIPIPQSGSQS